MAAGNLAGGGDSQLDEILFVAAPAKLVQTQDPQGAMSYDPFVTAPAVMVAWD